MIDLNELRRLAQEATPGPWKACRNHECYEGAYFEIDPEDEAEYAAKPFTRIEARTGVVAAAHDLFEFDRANAAFIAAANPAAIAELLDRLEAAEKERDALRAENAALVEDMNLLRNNNVALRAKIEQMEKQEPVAWLHENRRDSDVVTDAVKHVWGKAAVGSLAAYSIPLYTLPGAQAQPAPSVPDGFVWPECPKRRQSHVLFDDGYEEGWAACISTVKAMLTAVPSVPDAVLVAVADLVAQMEIVSRVGFIDIPNDKDSCAAFCMAEGTWLELVSCVESLAAAINSAPKPEE